jgi:hypothetical protein
MAVRGRPTGARSDVVVVVGTFVVLGALGGLLWSVLVSPAEFTRLSHGGAMGENDLGKQFGADGWYVVIGFLTSLVAGFVLTVWRSRDPLLTSLLLVVGAAVAAGLMAVVGHWAGPGDPAAALRTAKVGQRVPDSLDVDSFSVYLAWPLGVLVGSLFALLGRPPDGRDDGDHGRSPDGAEG